MDTIATQTYGNLEAGTIGRRKTVKVASGQNLAFGTLVRKVLSAVAAAGASNTGNGTAGTVTLGTLCKIGVYTLVATSLAGVISAGTVTAGGSNVGNGAAGTATPGADVKAGTYALECVATDLSMSTIAVEDLAADADIATREIWIAPASAELIEIGILTDGAPAGVDDSNTSVIAIKDSAGNTIVTKTYNTATQPPTSDYESLGTLDATHKILTADEHITLDVTNGTSADLPAFKLVIRYKTTTDADSAIFSVVDPDGYRLEDLQVGVAYSNDHFALTIADGTTDFAVGDTFTIAMTLNASATVFKVTDPLGLRLNDLTTGVAYDNSHFAVTIADGATDFAVGDSFTITVTDSGEVSIETDPNNVLAGVMVEAVDASLAAGYGLCQFDGEINEDVIVLGSGHAIASYREQLRAIGITLHDPQSR